jgi:hypothetical protein
MLIPMLLLLAQTYTVEKASDAVVVKSEGKETLRYQVVKPEGSALTAASACYFHPLTTPKGVTVTDVAPADHKHHRGIFLAWVEMHGKKDADFWGWGQYAPVKDRVIVNRAVTEIAGGEKAAFRVANDWMAEEVVLVKEDLQVKIRRDGVANVLDLVYTLTAEADVRLPKWAFSGFCARLRKDGKATIEGPEGEVKLAAPHHLKPESDWPAQPWYAYQIVLPDGTQVGAAVVDHPKNPKALWHNGMSMRMLNPCIVAPTELTIKAGEPLVFRYQVVTWDGPLPKDLLTSCTK